MLSRDTLLFLRGLLDQIKISTDGPGWRQSATSIAQAQDELDAAIADLKVLEDATDTL